MEGKGGIGWKVIAVTRQDDVGKSGLFSYIPHPKIQEILGDNDPCAGIHQFILHLLFLKHRVGGRYYPAGLEDGKISDGELRGIFHEKAYPIPFLQAKSNQGPGQLVRSLLKFQKGDLPSVKVDSNFFRDLAGMIAQEFRPILLWKNEGPRQILRP